MAKIGIMVVGTHGEVRPLVGLAIALQEAGHEVILCAPPNEEEWISSYGIKFHTSGNDMRGVINNLNKYMGHPVKLLRAVKETLQSIVLNQFQCLEEISGDLDLIIGSGEPFSAPSVAEKCGIPYIYVNEVAPFLPSSEYPPTVIPWQNMPKFMNKVSWKSVNTLINVSLVSIINENRKRLGLSSIKDFYDYFFDTVKVCIITVEKIFYDLPKLNFKCVQSGLWHVPEVVDDELEPGLVEFLKSGPPPVYIGFGSMSDKDPKETIKIIEEAIQILGIRAIISSGWAKLCKNTDSNKIYMIGFTSHKKLFPHVAAVVHHGGCGTSYSASWAGAPQIIIPHMLDHYYQGNMLYKKKLTPKPISRSKLTSEKLANAIKIAITDKDIIERNKKLGEYLRRVDKEGLKKAVDAIEEVLNETKQKNIFIS